MYQMKKTIEVYRNGTLQFVERQDLKNSDNRGVSIADRVGRCGVVGSVLLIGKQTKGVRSRLGALQHRQSFREVRQDISSSGSTSTYNVTSSSGNIPNNSISGSGLLHRGLLSSVSTLGKTVSCGFWPV